MHKTPILNNNQQIRILTYFDTFYYMTIGTRKPSKHPFDTYVNSARLGTIKANSQIVVIKFAQNVFFIYLCR